MRFRDNLRLLKLRAWLWDWLRRFALLLVAIEYHLLNERMGYTTLTHNLTRFSMWTSSHTVCLIDRRLKIMERRAALLRANLSRATSDNSDVEARIMAGLLEKR